MKTATFLRERIVPITFAFLIAALAMLAREATPVSAAAATITVNSNADADNPDAVLTLREAMALSRGDYGVDVLTSGECAQVSNCSCPEFGTCSTTDTIGAGSPDTIKFSATIFPPNNTPPGGQTITLGSALPDLTGTAADVIDGIGAGVAIDGGSDTHVCFPISGSNKTIRGIVVIRDCTRAFDITGATNTIGGLNLAEAACSGTGDEDSDGFVNDGCAANGAPETGAQCLNSVDNDGDGVVNDGCPKRGAGIVIQSNQSAGVGSAISISGESADSNIIWGNYIGTNIAGDAADANDYGVRILSGADGAFIGNGTDYGLRNIISGNTTAGVLLSGSSTTGNWLQNNYIGTSAAGTAAIANGSYGVSIESAASSNTIGFTSTRNVISGNNLGAGVHIDGSGTDSNVVEGNYIGTAADGSTDLGNVFEGVLISNSAASNVVGGTAAGAGNVISGNNSNGIYFFFAGSANRVENNYIGTNAAGTAALGNNNNGVYVNSTTGTIIGGTAANAGNVISGNGVPQNASGIQIYNSTSTTVQGNKIGTNAAGTSAIANGTGVSNSSGVQIDGASTSNTIGGLSGAARNIISGNTNWGVGISGTSATGNMVQGNYIGLNVSGSGAIANTTGVALWAPGNTVGGSASGAGNVIAGNSYAGVEIFNTTTTGNVVSGNYIGTDPMGITAYANGFGVIVNAAPGNTIGGSTAADRNIISGNSYGVYLVAAAATGNVIKGNYIGTNSTGASALGNFIGVEIETGAHGNTVGGATAGDRNVISGNTARGVQIIGSGADSNVVLGNYIGTNPAGSAAVSNGAGGVVIDGSAAGNTVGGSATGAGNLISGNAGSGVGISNSATSNIVQGNKIGTDATGVTGIANTTDGILIHSGANNNTIGGAGLGEGNTIAFNTDNGVCVLEAGAAATGEAIRGNSIYSNGGLGIDLAPLPSADCTTHTVTPNDGAGDADTGPNNLQNFPAISSSSSDGLSTTISGTLLTPSPDTATVDVYSTPSDGEGRFYLGSTAPSAGGAWTLIYGGSVPYGQLTATATKGGSTSEFSAGAASPLGPGLPLLSVANVGETPLGGGPTFAVFGPAAIADGSGKVVFWAGLSDSSQGIFTWTSGGGPPVKLFGTTDASPIGGTYSGFGQAPVINDASKLAFYATVSGGSASSGIFTGTSTADDVKIAAVGDTTPMGGSTYTSFTAPLGTPVPVINGDGYVSFFANYSTGSGLFLFDPVGVSVSKIAITGDAAPTGGTFTSFTSGYGGIPIVSETRKVSFWASASSGPAQGVFLWDNGTIIKVAAVGDAVPGGGTFTSFNILPMVNASGDVVFHGRRSSGSVNCTRSGVPCGVYVRSYSGTISKVMESGDSGPAGVGGVINDIEHPIINGSGQITVWVSLTNGASSQSIVRYTANGALTNVAAVGNCTCVTPPAGSFSTFIDASGNPTVSQINNLGQVSTFGAVSGGSAASGLFITAVPTSPVHVGPIQGAHVPGAGNGTFANAFDLGVNDSGEAVFTNGIVGGTATQGVFMFFAGDPIQPIRTLALQGGPALGDQFSTFGAPLDNGSGTVGVRATLNGSTDEGLYLFFAGSALPPPQRRARTGWADHAGGTFATFGEAAINSDGNLAGNANLTDGNKGLYMFFAGSSPNGDPLGNSTRQLAKSTLTDSFTPTGTYSSFGTPSVNLCVSSCPAGPSGVSTSGAYVAAKSTLTQQTVPGTYDQGLYLFFAGSAIDPPNAAPRNQIARTGGSDGNGSIFTAVGGGFSDPVINSQNGVVFTATTNTGKGLYLFFAGQALTKLADLSTGVPGGGTFSGFSSAVVGPGASPTQVSVFADATTSGGEGLYLFVKGQSVKEVAHVNGHPDCHPTTCNITFSGGSPVFPFVAMNSKLTVVFVSNIAVVPAGATQGVFYASIDQDADLISDPLDNCPATPNPPQANSDTDSLGDQCDNCPSWANQTQALPDWPVANAPLPAAPIDADCDGFPDIADAGGKARETYIGTDPTKHCNSTTASDDEPDAWPPDLNDNKLANGQDVGKFGGPFGAGNHTVNQGPFGPAGHQIPGQRFNFSGDTSPNGGLINGQDIGKYQAYFNKSCT